MGSGFRTRLCWSLLVVLLLVLNASVILARRPTGGRKAGSVDRPRRPKSSGGPASKAKAPPAASGSRKHKAGGKKKLAAASLDDEDDELEAFSSPKEKRRGGSKGSASSDLYSFGDRAVKSARSRRPLDEDEDEDEAEEEELLPSRGRGRGRPLDEEDEDEDEMEEDEADEDEDEEEEEDRYSRRKPSSSSSRRKGKGKGRYGRGDNAKGLAPYKQSYQVNRVPLQARLMRNVYALGEKAAGVVSKGRKMSRELKEYFSGDFESMLLKVTRPDDQRPPEEVLGAILDATGTFYRDEDVTASTNPYRVTLRKLWTKMAERDWRTVAKALYIFHVLLRECEPDDVRIFKKIYLKMGKEMCKKTKDRYFNIKRIEAVDSVEGEVLNAKSFIERYSKYVLQRAKTFTSKFEEMKVIGERDITAKDLVGQLLKAEKVISSGVECSLEAEDESEVTIMCTELVARDVHDLFRLFHDKLRWVVDHQDQALDGTDPEEVAKILDRFKTSYDQLYPKVQAFLSSTADMLSVYGIKLRTRLEPKHDFSATAAEPATAAEEEEEEVAAAPAPAAAGKAAAKGGKAAAAPAAEEYDHEEGTVEEEADLTAYDDATPWDGRGGKDGGDDYDDEE